MQPVMEPVESNIFTEQEFTEACSELDNPDVVGWDFFVESHGVKIYRQYNQATGLYSYKIYGVLKGIDPAVCAEVYMDLNYRKSWDGYVYDLRQVPHEDGKSLIYWQVKFPFPLSNRDYVYQRDMRELELNNSRVWVVLARATVSEKLPAVSGVVRVTDYIQSLALRSDQQNGTQAFMKYYDNPGGSIPTWLINWAAKNGVPTFLTDMQKACEGYKAYKERLAKA